MKKQFIDSANACKYEMNSHLKLLCPVLHTSEKNVQLADTFVYMVGPGFTEKMSFLRFLG